MVQRDDEAIREALVDRLEELGLTAYEAGALVGLSRLGTGTAKDVAKVGDVPRTRVYNAMETLHDRGLVDIQHTSPRKFTVVSRETVVRKLDLDRQNTVGEVGDLMERLGPVERQTEQFGVWTVTGLDTVAQRVFEFIEDADERIVYMTVDELLTEDHLGHLADADKRGLDVYVAGISDPVKERIREAVPSVILFESLWEWADTPAGSLLVTDEETALVSVRVDDTETGSTEETAIWGTGHRNSLVVVLRAIFTWRLETEDLGPDGP